MNLARSNYPPPPPPQAPSKTAKNAFHVPGTNLFPNIRLNLTRLEFGVQGIFSAILKKGLLLALLLGATLSFALSFVVQLATGLPATDFALLAIVAPISEEIFKGLSILIVAIFIWKTIPSRRYGALLGAAAGLGFSLAENIVYSISYASLSGQVVNGQVISGDLVAQLVAARWVGIPFMHVLWSAFIGIGVFVFLSQRKNSRNTPSWLAFLFPLVGLCIHILWNSIAIALSSLNPFVTIIIDVLIIFTPFAIMFRDFLGGHFNFTDFLRPVQEPMQYQQTSSFPPPPPPPPL